MSVEDYIDLLNDYHGKRQCDNRILIYIIITLLDKKNLITVKACDLALEQINFLMRAIKKSKLSEEEKSFWEKYTTYGTTVCNDKRMNIINSLRKVNE